MKDKKAAEGPRTESLGRSATRFALDPGGGQQRIRGEVEMRIEVSGRRGAGEGLARAGKHETDEYLYT